MKKVLFMQYILHFLNGIHVLSKKTTIFFKNQGIRKFIYTSYLKYFKIQGSKPKREGPGDENLVESKT